ncbi:MAG: 23S rRNA (guanosine(2251)-2'-O)-methyltransferase RlmB [Actinomycetota bacterium]|nr:MAG: 23S rRNA (guanosine(2251)-2'-O)-methyltransferase RlmB [Actinomycetota bacterium]
MQDFEYLYGINTINTLLKVNTGNRKIFEIIISAGRKKDKRLKDIMGLAQKRAVPVKVIEDRDLKDISGQEYNPQGIMAKVSSYNSSNLDDYLEKEAGTDSRLIILDGVTDVGNFGSIIRNCYAFGFDGIVIGKNRSVSLNRKVSRISAGALEGTRIFKVPNIVQTIRKLKTAQFWIYGTTLTEDPHRKILEKTDFTFPMALVMGSEDRGTSRLVAENCDIMISIRLTGKMQSLNVSVASGIILHHIQEKFIGVKSD